ncbi:acyltransferase family protein [Dyella acidiphila]|uniref:Acyltransferase n=1 Tax=Dyella acidiphila TaxID=2775866 RepID=A0ABR9G580_9GAMM|nr:acyltransferase [Dyella acidiphila]
MKAKQQNTDIECLRAVAVLGVAFHHMQGNLFHPGLPQLQGFLQHFSYWFGVDLFLAISGYVIGRSLLPQLRSPGERLPQQWTVVMAFWIRRAWRLLPSAWLWLAIILGATVLTNRSGAFGSLHANLMASLAGVLNVANLRFADAFFRYEYGTSFVYWSLSLEEQFYLLLPLLVLCLRRRIDLLMIALVVMQFLLFRTPLWMALRTDAIALGVLLSMAESSIAYARAEPAFLLRLGALRVIMPMALLTLLAMLAAPALQDLQWRISAIAAISAALVWLASYDKDYLLPAGRLKQLLTWIGHRSYAIYLIHIPAYFFLREVAFRADLAVTAPLHALAWAATGVALTLALADLNYRFLEQPLRRHGRAVADRYLSRRGVHRAKATTAPPDLVLPVSAEGTP